MKGIYVYYDCGSSGDGEVAVKALGCDAIFRTFAVKPVPGVVNVVQGPYALTKVDEVPSLTDALTGLQKAATQGAAAVVMSDDAGAENPAAVCWFKILGAEARRLGMTPIAIVYPDVNKTYGQAKNARAGGCALCVVLMDAREDVAVSHWKKTADAILDVQACLALGTPDPMDCVLTFAVGVKRPVFTDQNAQTVSPATFARRLDALKTAGLTNIVFWNWGDANNPNDPVDGIAAHAGPGIAELVKGF